MADHSLPTQTTRAVGDLVRYQKWTGRVYKVYPDGGMLIDFTVAGPFWIPFFRGPYRPDEVTDA